MPTSYTSLLGLALPVTGELTGTWGDTVNNYLTQYLDSAVAGVQTISGSQTAVTLSKTTAGSLAQAGSGATGSSQYMIINCTGNPAGTLTITAPAASKVYVVLNATSTAQSVKIVGAGPTTGVTLVAGEEAVVAWNGTDFIKAASTVLTALTGTLGVANGGTGATTLTGIVKGSGTSAFSAATAGTDYVAPGTATSFTALQTFSGSSSVAAMKMLNAKEACTVSATAATGTINYDVTTQSVLYYTSNASGNWTVNFRGSSGTSLNTLMSTGETVTAAFLVTQGATAYYNSAVQIDGSSVTPKYQGGIAWSAGNPSSIDVYTYTIVKTGSAAFTVFASQAQFK